MRTSSFLLAAALTVLVGCSDSPVSPAAPTDSFAAIGVADGIPANATVSFGIDGVGSPFPPVPGHDASYHAKDKVNPRTVVIRAGGSVTFEMAVFHQVAIHDQGIGPDDIDVSATIDLTAPPPAPPGTVIIPDFIIDDAVGRLALSPFSFAPMTWTSPPGTFDAPGTYLVICTVVPHFVQAGMYAWVIVK